MNDRLIIALQDLIAASEVMQNTSGYYRKTSQQQISSTQWSAWSKQLKIAKLAMGEDKRKDVADAQLKVKEARIATLEAELLKYHEEIAWLYDEVQFNRDDAARTRNNSANEDIEGLRL